MFTEHSIDGRGFIAFLKFSALLVILFSSAHYGSHFLFDSVYAVEYNTSHFDKKLVEIKHAREVNIQEQLKELAILKDQNRILEPQVFSGYKLGDFIPEEGKLIAADLEQMKLFLYEDGKQIDNFNILSKGEKGSRWETPAGLYEVLTKERNHFSSLGLVYMPYSMQFYGNFFIHGWPYYPDGTLVAQGYSGGCIRLSTDSAREVFEFAQKGTAMFVYEKNESKPLVSVSIRNVPKPSISARSAIIADINTDSVYFEKNPDVLMPIASITKLVTALVSNETISFGKKIIVKDYTKNIGGYSGNVKNGDVFYAEDLIYPLLMESNNDVAHSLSSYYGDEKFIKLMDKKARALGMYDTAFGDASGISSKNISTANDLFRLSKYLYGQQSFVLNTTRKSAKEVRSLNGTKYTFNNFNIFADDENFVGGKTGFTNAAGETMLSIFDINVDGATSTIAIIILDSENREQDIKNLKRWFTVVAVPAGKKLSLFNAGADFYRYLGESLSDNLTDMVASVFSAGK
jgi:D-alanyl-D-alanine carboxypeptidase